MSAHFSFWQILRERAIAIPLLQRDYAQGRSDADTTRMRKAFLAALRKAVESEANALSLDFVYGTTEGVETPLTPLDGQQRLTTLWLLHWYLAAKKGLLTPEVSKILNRFSYEHRISAQAFCKCLSVMALSHFSPSKTNTLANYLRNQPWFQESWNRDATVSGMLTMLTDIAEVFHTAPDTVFADLSDDTKAKIKFAYFSLDQYGLSDALYVRMNARGRALTPFENWKAQFEELLQKYHGEDTKKSFAEAIDGRWTTFFWLNNSEAVRNEATNPAALVDEPFKRLLDFITQMLWHADQPEKTAVPDAGGKQGLPFSVYESVYGAHDNLGNATIEAIARLAILRKALNSLDQLSAEGILTTRLFARNEPVSERVVLYWSEERKDVRIFDNLLQASRNLTELDEVLLFSVLLYTVTRGEQLIDLPVLRDTVRIVRNLWRGELRDPSYYPAALRAICTFVEACAHDVDAYAVLATHLPVEHWNRFAAKPVSHEYEKATLITTSDVPKERKSAVHQLEDLIVFKGNIANVRPLENALRLSDFATAASAIWQASDAVIAQALLSFGEYGALEYEGYKINLGGKIDHSWNMVLGRREPGVKNLLPELFERFIEVRNEQSERDPEEVLDVLVKRWLQDSNKNDDDWTEKWRPFLSYKSMLTVPDWYRRIYLCSFENGGQRYVKLLSKSKRSSKGFCPYARTVEELIKDRSIARVDYDLATANESPLILPDIGAEKIYGEMYFAERKGWWFWLPDTHQLSDQLKADFLWSDDGKWLIGPKGQQTDFLQTAAEFVTRISRADGVTCVAKTA